MVKQKVFAWVILPVLVAMSACSPSSVVSDAQSQSSNVEADASDSDAQSYANYTPRPLYPAGIPSEEPISIGEATLKVTEIVGENIPESKFSCESVDLINERIYYIFRGYNDFPDRIATFGYYAVDIFTGDVFDTNVLTDLVPLS